MHRISLYKDLKVLFSNKYKTFRCLRAGYMTVNQGVVGSSPSGGVREAKKLRNTSISVDFRGACIFLYLLKNHVHRKRFKMKVQRNSTEDLSTWFQEFLEEKKFEGVSTYTLRDYDAAYTVFRREGGNRLDQDCIHDFISYLNECGSTRSINHYLRALRVFANWCSDKGYIEPIKIKLIKIQEKNIETYSEEECKKLLAQPDSKATFREWRTYTMVSLLLATGARLSTIINIQKEDIDYENREISYRHLKTKDRAIIPISPTLFNILKKYQSLFITDKYLFCDYDNNKMTPNSVRISMRLYCKNRDVKYKGIHTVRHTFARFYILNGGDAFTLQKILCHKDMSICSVLICTTRSKCIHRSIR